MNNIASFNRQPEASTRSTNGSNNGGALMRFAPSPMVKSDQLPALAAAASMRAPTRKTRGRKTRRVWSKEEDSALEKLVVNHHFDATENYHWSQIAAKMNKNKPKSTWRSGKQCRDRWQNHLRSDIKKGAWTKEEEHMIREMHEAFGTKWSCMAKLMENRSDNDIKNKWYSMVRSEQKARKRREKAGNDGMDVESTMPAGLKQGDNDEPYRDQATANSYEAATTLPYLKRWQGGEATTYETVPYEPNSVDVKPDDHLLLSTAATPGAMFGWTFGEPYPQNLASLYNPQLVVNGFGAIASDTPTHQTGFKNGVAGLDLKASSSEANQKMPAIETDTEMHETSVSFAHAAYSRHGMMDEQLQALPPPTVGSTPDATGSSTFTAV